MRFLFLSPTAAAAADDSTIVTAAADDDDDDDEDVQGVTIMESSPTATSTGLDSVPVGLAVPETGAGCCSYPASVMLSIVSVADWTAAAVAGDVTLVVVVVVVVVEVEEVVVAIKALSP